MRTVVIVGGAVGSVAFSAVGVGLLAAAGSSKQERDDLVDLDVPGQCYKLTPPCAKADNNDDVRINQQTTGTVALMLGSLGAAATLAYVVLPGHTKVAVTGSGIAVEGVW